MEKNMIGKYLRDLRRRRGMSPAGAGLGLGSKQADNLKLGGWPQGAADEGR